MAVKLVQLATSLFAIAVAASCSKKPSGDRGASTVNRETSASAAESPDSVTGGRKPPSDGRAGGPVAPIDDKALDAAIASKGFQPSAVRQRAIGVHSAWAVVQAPPTAEHKVVEFDILRVRTDGAALLPLTPTPRKHSTWWDSDVDPIEVRDLAGDGNEQCLVVLTWLQDIPGTGTGEAAKQLYVIGGNAALKVAATAIVDYSTLSQQMTDHDKTDPPPAEHIGYDWTIGGKPPTLSLKRTESQLNKKRAQGLTEPGTEPLLSGGETKNVALDLK